VGFEWKSRSCLLQTVISNSAVRNIETSTAAVTVTVGAVTTYRCRFHRRVSFTDPDISPTNSTYRQITDD
jgi:hypothetical protein